MKTTLNLITLTVLICTTTQELAAHPSILSRSPLTVRRSSIDEDEFPPHLVGGQEALVHSPVHVQDSAPQTPVAVDNPGETETGNKAQEINEVTTTGDASTHQIRATLAEIELLLLEPHITNPENRIRWVNCILAKALQDGPIAEPQDWFEHLPEGVDARTISTVFFARVALDDGEIKPFQSTSLPTKHIYLQACLLYIYKVFLQSTMQFMAIQTDLSDTEHRAQALSLRKQITQRKRELKTLEVLINDVTAEIQAILARHR